MKDISKTNQSAVKKRPSSLFIFLVFAGIVSFLSIFSMCGISKDYKERSYVAEGFAVASKAKIAIAEFYEKEKYFPKDNKEAGLVEPNQITGQAVSSVAIKSNGRILITYNHKVFDGAELYLVPIMQDKKITWECRESDDPIKRIDLEILPYSCRSATMDKN